MSRPRVLTGIVACVLLSGTGIAHADAVTDWNAIALQTVNAAVPPRPGPSAVLDLAIVHAAVYDAVEAIDGRFRPYHVRILGASGSPAAAAAAAHDVLVNRFPAQAASLDSTYHDYLDHHGLLGGTDEMSFSVATTNPLALQRTSMYERFSDAAADVVTARVYEGIHFRFADTEAREQGRHVAQWAFSHFLKPVDDDDHDDGADDVGH
jgi:hypothetical protein